MDAAECEHASLICISEGGPLGIMFAATYPERVDHLVLYSTTPCYRWFADYPWGRTDEQHLEDLDIVSEHWGTGFILATIIGLEPDEHTIEFLSRYERNTATFDRLMI